MQWKRVTLICCGTIAILAIAGLASWTESGEFNICTGETRSTERVFGFTIATRTWPSMSGVDLGPCVDQPWRDTYSFQVINKLTGAKGLYHSRAMYGVTTYKQVAIMGEILECSHEERQVIFSRLAEYLASNEEWLVTADIIEGQRAIALFHFSDTEPVAILLSDDGDP